MNRPLTPRATPPSRTFIPLAHSSRYLLIPMVDPIRNPARQPISRRNRSFQVSTNGQSQGGSTTYWTTSSKHSSIVWRIARPTVFVLLHTTQDDGTPWAIARPQRRCGRGPRRTSFTTMRSWIIQALPRHLAPTVGGGG